MNQENPPSPPDIQPLTSKQGVIVIVTIVLCYIPPPRAFVAVAGDLVQIFVLAGALIIPVLVLLVTVDVSHTASVGNQVVERVTARLSAMRGQVTLVLTLYILVMLWLVFVKLICTWFDRDNWKSWVIDRPLIALTGGFVMLTLIQSVVLYSILNYVDFLNWVGHLLKVRR
jgi:hypothetical protein